MKQLYDILKDITPYDGIEDDIADSIVNTYIYHNTHQVAIISDIKFTALGMLIINFDAIRLNTSEHHRVTNMTLTQVLEMFDDGLIYEIPKSKYDLLTI
jgi:hypothetical protein